VRLSHEKALCGMCDHKFSLRLDLFSFDISILSSQFKLTHSREHRADELFANLHKRRFTHVLRNDCMRIETNWVKVITTDSEDLHSLQCCLSQYVCLDANLQKLFD